MALVTDGQRDEVVGLDQKPQVVVFVGGAVLPGRDDVNIEIKHSRGSEARVVQSRFLPSLAEGRFGPILALVGVASQLNPLIQFGMVG